MPWLLIWSGHHQWMYSLQWRHNEHDCVSNHQPHDCLLNQLFRHRSKKIWKLRITGLCVGNSPMTGEFPVQRASNAENVSIWWHHHVMIGLVFPEESNQPSGLFRWWCGGSPGHLHQYYWLCKVLTSYGELFNYFFHHCGKNDEKNHEKCKNILFFFKRIGQQRG